MAAEATPHQQYFSASRVLPDERFPVVVRLEDRSPYGTAYTAVAGFRSLEEAEEYADWRNGRNRSDMFPNIGAETADSMLHSLAEEGYAVELKHSAVRCLWDCHIWRNEWTSSKRAVDHATWIEALAAAYLQVINEREGRDS
jgi:hypothetical protein